MVDTTKKKATVREAVASGSVYMKEETLRLIQAGSIVKGDVLTTAKLAGIMAAKKTPHLIPLCHPINISHADLELRPAGSGENTRIEITATVKCEGKKGVEMEALTAVAVAALTIYDMCKAADKEMVISEIRLEKKMGGRSGLYVRPS